jgi:hypothetical protein
MESILAVSIFIGISSRIEYIHQLGKIQPILKKTPADASPIQYFWRAFFSAWAAGLLLGGPKSGDCHLSL